jgi:hypothetical protein
VKRGAAPLAFPPFPFPFLFPSSLLLFPFPSSLIPLAGIAACAMSFAKEIKSSETLQKSSNQYMPN